MAKLLRNWMVIAVALVLAIASVPCSATAQPASSGFKQSWEKITRFFSPTTSSEPANDAVSLSNQAKPGPGLYLATARMHEQKGELDLAEKQYKQGLRLAANHLALQLGYARLKDRAGRLEEAIKLYQEAARLHPTEAAIFNDMGLCQARSGKLPEAVAALEIAARLQPQRKLYRNNLATVLMEMGQIDAALVQLKAVYPEAIACYNLGYLLQKKGELRLATVYFARALERDPSLTPARVWLDRLAGSAAPNSQPPVAASSPPPLRMTIPPGRASTASPSGPGAPAGATTAPGWTTPNAQMSARGRAPEAPRPLPPVEPQAGNIEPRSASQSAGTRFRVNSDPRRPVALPPIDEAPPSRGQSPPDLSVPVPNGSAREASPSAAASPSSRLAQHPSDPTPPRVRPLPPVENAPLPPSGDQGDPRFR